MFNDKSKRLLNSFDVLVLKHVSLTHILHSFSGVTTTTTTYMHTLSDKVREVTTVCLAWQQWTENSVWLLTLVYQRFTAVLLLIYGSLFLIGVYY
jgi:hypothetical protein